MKPRKTATSCSSDQGGGCDNIFLAGGKNVYLNQISGGSVGIYGDQHVLVQNSTFGPCYSGTVATGDCTNNTKIDTNWVNCSSSCPPITSSQTRSISWPFQAGSRPAAVFTTAAAFFTYP